MPFQEGHKHGKGRPKGSPNKDTKELREAFKVFVEDNTDKFQGWLDKVAREDPAKALTLIKDMAEYVLPKLARTEVKNEHSGELKVIRPKRPEE